MGRLRKRAALLIWKINATDQRQFHVRWYVIFWQMK